MAKKLFIPGPVEVAPEILQAMATPMIGHRMPEYALLHKGVKEKLKKVLFTEGRVFLATSSAFGVMEGAVRNLVGKRCANFCNGAFSDKWHDVTRRCGKEADPFTVEWGKPITPELVDQALATGRYDAITLIHNETSTGVMSPLPEIAEVLKKYPDVISIIDTVSSMSALRRPLPSRRDWRSSPPAQRPWKNARESRGGGIISIFSSLQLQTKRTTPPQPPVFPRSTPWTGSSTAFLPKGWRGAGRGTGRWPIM